MNVVAHIRESACHRVQSQVRKLVSILPFDSVSREALANVITKGETMDRKNDLEPRDGTLHSDRPGEEVGEAVGGVSGVVAGAAIGSAAGPIGTIIGGIAGAVGGWWAGKAVADASHKFTQDDDAFYRERFETSPDRLADRSYDDVRPAYQLGHIASMNPDYNGRSFDEIEPELRHGWGNDLRARHGDWSAVRPYAEQAYSRNTSVAEREFLNRQENTTENLRDNLGDATRRGANRVVDAVDNVKDRIDGNPASKPGPDPTDRRF
jgi:hypothetical protein